VNLHGADPAASAVDTQFGFVSEAASSAAVNGIGSPRAPHPVTFPWYRIHHRRCEQPSSHHDNGAWPRSSDIASCSLPVTTITFPDTPGCPVVGRAAAQRLRVGCEQHRWVAPFLVGPGSGEAERSAAAASAAPAGP
jgi:hypothetical protein